MDKELPELYPSLWALARDNNCNLLNYKTVPKNDNYLGLRECCEKVLSGKRISVPQSIGEYNYLATIDKFVKKLGSDESKLKKLWRKISKPSGSRHSGFLDTVVEAAWAIHFLERGLKTCVEEPFKTSKNTKDADVTVVFNDMKYWLDARSVDLEDYIKKRGFSFPNPVEWDDELGRCRSLPPISHLPPIDNLIRELGKRALNKYSCKFRDAVTSGSLHGTSVGILLCVLKYEMVILPNSYVLERSLPPEGLFGDKNPGLKVVCIHTLRPGQNSDVLKPIYLTNWPQTYPVFCP
jgi:hypothetical protein